MTIHNFKDIIKEDVDNDIIKEEKKYNFGYRLIPYENSDWKYLSWLLEFLFYIFKFFQKPPTNNNIMRVIETVTIARGYKQVECLGLLDTGNEGPTLVKREILEKIGFTDKDFSSKYLSIKGIGGLSRVKTVNVDYKFCNFIHTEKIGVSNYLCKYDVIIGRNAISKMYHSGYNLYI